MWPYFGWWIKFGNISSETAIDGSCRLLFQKFFQVSSELKSHKIQKNWKDLYDRIMSSKNYEESGYGLDLDLLTISY
jgi:hypothetical protein